MAIENKKVCLLEKGAILPKKVSKLQVAILARSSREMSQTVRID